MEQGDDHHVTSKDKHWNQMVGDQTDQTELSCVEIHQGALRMEDGDEMSQVRAANTHHA